MLREYALNKHYVEEQQRRAEQQRIAKEVQDSKKEQWVSRRLRRFGLQ